MNRQCWLETLKYIRKNNMELLIVFSYLLPIYGIGMVLVNEKLKEKN